MSVGRYRRTPRLDGGQKIGTSRLTGILFAAAKSGNIPCRTHVLAENERLDHLAGRYLGDGQLWWVIAACSGVGWFLQVPPGTRLKIPTDLDKVMAYIG
jgi:hypothetical protein